jgi:hypothetical protein
MDRFVDRAVTLVDKDGVPFSSTNPIPTGIIVEDIQIGAVELKNATTDDRAKIALLSALAASDLGLGVTDPVTKAALLGILGAIDGAAVVSDANGTQQQYLRGLVKLWIAGLAAGEAHIGAIGGNKTAIAVEFTRENNATPYGAGDVVSNAAAGTTPMDFATAARVGGGSGYVVGAKLIYNVKSVVPRTRVHLFNVNTATLAGDNLQWKEVYADSSKRVGYFDLPAMVTGADATNSDMSRSIAFDFRLPYVCAAASQHIYAVLETLDAVTLTSGSKVTLTLMFEQD